MADQLVRLVLPERGLDLCPQTTVAASIIAKFMGLMGRESMAPDEGLWFPGDTSLHTCFMRFPIDVVFLGRPDSSSDRSVTHLRPHLRPWISLVPPLRGAAGFVELPDGVIAATGVAVGDRVRFVPYGPTAAVG
jgi:uncharacterized membrane protein (UPF0127 family)